MKKKERKLCSFFFLEIQREDKGVSRKNNFTPNTIGRKKAPCSAEKKGYRVL